MKKKLALACLAALLLALGAAADDNTSNLKFVVLKEDNGKPVRNASVVLHPVNKEGRQEKGGFELKTDADGKAQFPGAPYGKLRVQVLVRGFQTYGEDFDVNQPEQEIVVKLKRPQQQYSIYPEEKKPAPKPKQ
jgi:5-hydroxyisourate hydrolase-like protein (transthyretin family)